MSTVAESGGKWQRVAEGWRRGGDFFSPGWQRVAVFFTVVAKGGGGVAKGWRFFFTVVAESAEGWRKRGKLVAERVSGIFFDLSNTTKNPERPYIKGFMIFAACGGGVAGSKTGVAKILHKTWQSGFPAITEN